MDRFLKEETMECVICKFSEVESKTLDMQIEVGRDIVLVPMNIIVCSNCGERYYNTDIMAKIEQIKSKQMNRELDVVEIGKVMRCRYPH